MPTANLTAQTIKSLSSPDQQQTDYWDTSTTGFGCRVSATGQKTYVVRYRLRGTRRLRRVTVGSANRLDLASARKRAKEILANAELGVDTAAILADTRRAALFGEVAESFLTARRNRSSYGEMKRKIDNMLTPVWAGRAIRDIGREDVRELVRRISIQRGPVAANRLLSLIVALFNFALNELGAVDFNPAARLEKPGEEHARERVLDDREIKAFWRALDEEQRRNSVVGALYKLRLLTAQRCGELRNMTWDAVDLDCGWWALSGTDTKNRMPHRVPLTRTAIDILRGLRDQQCRQAERLNERYVNCGTRGGPEHRPCHVSQRWVFSSPRPWQERDGELRFVDAPIQRHLSNADERIRRAAKLANFRMHDLRHTAATIMARHGVPRDIAKRILNHKTGTAKRDITNVYDQYSYEPERRDALEHIERHVLAVAAGRRCPDQRCTADANVRTAA